MTPLADVIAAKLAEVGIQPLTRWQVMKIGVRSSSDLDRLDACAITLAPGFTVHVGDQVGHVVTVLSRTLIVEMNGEQHRSLVPIRLAHVDPDELCWTVANAALKAFNAGTMSAGARGRPRTRKQMEHGWASTLS